MSPKKIIGFALGPIGGAILGFISLPIITWFFTQEDVGRITMLNVVCGFSTMIFSLGLDQAYIREFHESNNRAALFKLTILPGLVLLTLTLIILLSFNNIISIWIFDIDNNLLSVLISAAIISGFIARFLSLILRMNENGLAYSMSQLLPKLLLILIICGYILFSLKKDITNLVLANVSSIIFVCLIYIWNTRKEWSLSVKEDIDFIYLKELLTYGIPLIFGGLAFWGLTVTDKIFLKELSNFEQLGLYSVAVSFASAAAIFQNIFSTIWAPVVYKWASAGEGLDKIYKVNRYVLIIVILIFCLGGLFSWLVTYILPSNYNDVQWIIVPCLGFPLLYTLSETTVIGIGIMRRSGFSMFASIISFLINLVGNWWLIPILGATGAAISTCISFWIFFILRTEFSIYVWKTIPRLALYSYSSLLVFGSIIHVIYGRTYQYEIYFYWSFILISIPFVFKLELMEITGWLNRKIK